MAESGAATLELMLASRYLRSLRARSPVVFAIPGVVALLSAVAQGVRFWLARHHDPFAWGASRIALDGWLRNAALIGMAVAWLLFVLFVLIRRFTIFSSIS